MRALEQSRAPEATIVMGGGVAARVYQMRAARSPAPCDDAQRPVSHRGGRDTVVGVVVFAALVYETGPATILASVRACGSAFLVLIALTGVRHLLRTLAWRTCIEPGRRIVAFVDLFGIRLAAEAVTDLTFAGPVLGESVKELTVARRMDARRTRSPRSSSRTSRTAFRSRSSSRAASSCSPPVRPCRNGRGSRPRSSASASSRRWPRADRDLPTPAAALVDDRILRAPRRAGAQAIARRRDAIRRFEEQVIAFYAERRGIFVVVLALETLACLAGVLEAYVILIVVAGHATVYAAFLVESVNRVVNAFFPFVPLRVGADEGDAGSCSHARLYYFCGCSRGDPEDPERRMGCDRPLFMARYAIASEAAPVIAEVGDGEGNGSSSTPMISD